MIVTVKIEGEKNTKQRILSLLKIINILNKALENSLQNWLEVKTAIVAVDQIVSDMLICCILKKKVSFQFCYLELAVLQKAFLESLHFLINT